MNPDLDEANVEEWLDENKSQRKALKTILDSLEKEQNNHAQISKEAIKSNNIKKTNIMSKIKQLFKKLGVFVLPILLAGSMNLHAQETDFVPGKIRVKIEASAVTLVSQSLSKTDTGAQLKTGVTSMDKLNAEYSANKMTRVFPFAGKNEGRHMKYGLHLWYEISIDSKADLLAVADAYTNNEAIIVSEPIRAKTLDYDKIIEVPETMGSATSAAFTTNDPYLGNQWHYSNDGSLPKSIAGSDINLFNAWEITKGSPNVIVSIVDGGIDVDHEDLEANVWINEAELNGEEGVDDDFNGYIDDINGYNFADAQGAITAHDHGTHVAGTVAAVSNNGIGVAGVAGGSGNNDGIKLMSSQVFSNTGQGNFAAAIVYGADNGAVISQNSWGYGTPGDYEQAVLNAIDYFIAEAGNYNESPMKGGVILFAAGNGGENIEHYPGFYESTIAVGSIGTDFTKAYYSNYGDWVDITTVGGDLYYGTESAILSTMPDNKYGYMQGTSMATPHASGVAALIVSKYGSSTFTNTDLKQRFFTGVKDINQYNPDYMGKLGVGYIDAALALADDDMMAPNTITDFAVNGISESFANVSWTVPADAVDATPSKYILNIATDAAFTDKTSVIIENDFKNAGDVIEYTVDKLLPITTYYFAVVAIDRWGNASQMSNIVEATTNRGPDVATDVSSVNVDIDITSASTGMTQLQLLNNDEGVLNWSAETREVRVTADYNKVQYPKEGTQKSAGQIEVLREKVLEIEKFDSNKAGVDAWEASEIRKHANTPIYTIGDTDTTMTNSSASRFTVKNPKGFNLSSVSAYLNLDNVDGPVILEIYAGEEMTKENLLYVSDAIKGYSENDSRDFNHNLTEQLFFEEGESFWVVYHIPAGNLYPLGIAPELSPEYSDDSFMSFDLGKTWISLESAIENNNFVWKVLPKSTIQPLHDYVNLTPNEGNISGIGSEDILVDVDASQLINGTYKSNIVFRSNDSDTPNHRVPLQVKVTNHKPELNSFNILDFGSVFSGLSSTKEMTIENSGFGRFKTKTITSSNPQFKVESSTYSLNVPALEEKPIVLTFTPDGTGNANAVITMTSYKGDVYTFNVFGVGTEPAQLTLENDVYNFNDVMIGDELTDIIKITNTGQYPLQYGFPNFADDLSHIENLPENVQRFGYVTERMDYPVDYVFNDISSTGTEITEFFNKDGRNQYYKVDLGFDFPYFGKNISELFITPNGTITVGENGSFLNSPEFHGDAMPEGYIAGLWNRFDFAKAGTVHFKYELGKLIVQYTNARKENDRDTVGITFQIEIRNDGDILFIYDKFEGLYSYQLKNFYSAIENIEKNDGVVVNSNAYSGPKLPIGEKVIAHIHSPGIGLIESVVAEKGQIQPGESAELLMTIAKDKLIEGNFEEYIAVVSNDPFNASQVIKVNINVIGGGVSELVIDPLSVDLGDVFQNAKVKGVVTAKNNGTKSLEISGLNFKNGQLTYAGEQNVIVGPNQTMYIDYELITSELMVVDDVLTLVDSESNEYTVTFTGNVVDAPSIEVVETSYELSMEVDTEMTKEFTVKNNGKGTLEYAMASTEHVTLVETAAPDNVQDITYVHRSSYDEVEKPSYQWFKLTVEDKVPFDIAGHDFWEVIELPFEFDFYQNKYSQIWMGSQGVLTFDEPENQGLVFFPPPNIPEVDIINNMIAPYFAAGGPDVGVPEDDRGSFVKAFDDKVVFEWRNYVDNLGGLNSYSFQAIIYKNGTIKFQYKKDKANRTKSGLIGIENKEGTDGTQIAHYQTYFEDGVAVEFSPAKKHILAPNESKDFDLNISAIDVNAGEYEESVKVISNDPLNTSINIPIALTVTGEAALAFNPEVVDFGEQILIPDASFVDEISFINTGKRTMIVSNVRLEDGSTAKLEHLVAGFFGSSWQELKATDSFTVEPGFESGNIRLTIIPDGPYEAYANTVLVDTDYGTTESLPITAIFNLPPKFTVNADPIYHMAYNDDVFTHILNLGNVEGESPLKYNISLNYAREEATAAKDIVSKKVGTPVIKKHNLTVSQKSNVTAKLANTFATVLAHDNKTEVETSIGVDDGTVFTAATEFVAPKDGFNLSHVQTWYVPSDLLDSDITVEIRVGESVAAAKVMHTELMKYSIDTADDYGELVTFKLSDEIVLLPYEKFYVLFSYPFNASYPQGAISIPEPVMNRYMFYYNNVWYDVAETTVNEYGWMTRAAEETKSDLNWISFDGETDGSIEMTQSMDLSVNLHPAKASQVSSAASIQIETNDPDMLSTIIPVTLDVNQAPGIQTELYYVNETETLSVEIAVEDNEGDMITDVQLVNNYENVSMSYDNGLIKFAYSPTYEDAGYHSFDVSLTDGNGISGVSSINVEVVNVNRAPIANAVDVQYLNLIEDDFRIVLDDSMDDPDGDALTYDAVASNGNVVEVYFSDRAMVVKPIAQGSSVVTITGVDTEGAFTTNDIQFVVSSKVTDDDTLKYRWSILENPVAETLTLTMKYPIVEEVNVRIISMLGGTVKTFTAEEATTELQIPVSNLAAGVYFVELTTQEAKSVRKIVKN